jgi:hypothetical protein
VNDGVRKIVVVGRAREWRPLEKGEIGRRHNPMASAQLSGAPLFPPTALFIHLRDSNRPPRLRDFRRPVDDGLLVEEIDDG